MDKTETITVGKPLVQNIYPLNEKREDELIQVAASLEMSSSHPLALAVIEYAKEKQILPLRQLMQERLSHWAKSIGCS